MAISKGIPLCTIPPYMSEEEILTTETYKSMFYRIARMAESLCIWEGLPEETPGWLIERYLFYFGNCVFFRDEILDKYLVLPITTEYSWDQNERPIDYEVHGFMGYRRRLNVNNSVIIYNDNQLTPGSFQSQLFASRLTNALRTGDMHLEALKIGKIVVAPENKQRGIKEIIRRIRGFQLFTIASPAAKDLADSIQVLDTELDAAIKDIDNHYTFVWHDVLAYYGIESMSDKTSGVSKEEVQSESSMAKINRNAVLEARKEGIKKINKMFGLNVKVDINKEEGEQNGEIHNNTENSNGEPDGENRAR